MRGLESKRLAAWDAYFKVLEYEAEMTVDEAEE